MRRRNFIALLGGAAIPWPFAARAQQSDRIRRLGILMPTTPADVERQADLTALQQRLAELGWMAGRNLSIDYRWGGGDIDRTRNFAGELVRQSPDVIFACFNAQLAPLSRETSTIPIVFVGVSDPVGSGYVASFARPGGNITGFTLYEPSMAGKWLETLKEIAPSLTHVALMLNPDTATLRGKLYSRAFETATASFSVQHTEVAVRSAANIETAITALGQKTHSGLIVGPDTFTEAHAELIVALAARHRVPTIYGLRHFPKRGGLVSYGPDTADTFRRAASYIDRILRGESPAELPVQAQTKFHMVVNLKTAKTLGLDIPPTLLALADEVIE